MPPDRQPEDHKSERGGVAGLPVGVERRARRGGDKFRTRWRDPVTKRKLSAQYGSVAEVVDFRARLTVARARGEIAELARGDRTVAEYHDQEWWPRHAERNLKANTREAYASVWRRHLQPHIGDLPLRQLTAPGAVRLREMLYDLEVGEPSIARALVVLQGICHHAISAGEIKVNPLREVDKPSPDARLSIQAPGADVVEALRAELDDESAALVSLIAYTGLRPSEALGLAHRHLRRATVLVERRVINGAFVTGQKTTRGLQRPHRQPPLYDAVRGDLEPVLAGRRRRPNALVFAGREGRPWTVSEYRRWREQVFAAAVKRARVQLARPYDLRHGAASMRLFAGMPLSLIAEEMGHTVVTLSSYYSHEIEDLRGAVPIPMQEQIADARATRGERMRRAS